MGMGLFKNCSSATSYPAPAPNPSPRHWQLLDVKRFPNAYVLVVRYLGCTNFEGVKVMVYRGTYKADPTRVLDPHFSEADGGPVARFRPDETGLAMAEKLAASL